MTESTPRTDPERDGEWRSRLTTLQYHVTREAGTEMPNTGIHNMEERDGCYNCLCCGHLLFTSEMKYCLLYTSPSPRDQRGSRMPSSA